MIDESIVHARTSYRIELDESSLISFQRRKEERKRYFWCCKLKAVLRFPVGNNFQLVPVLIDEFPMDGFHEVRVQGWLHTALE